MRRLGFAKLGPICASATQSPGEGLRGVLAQVAGRLRPPFGDGPRQSRAAGACAGGFGSLCFAVEEHGHKPLIILGCHCEARRAVAIQDGQRRHLDRHAGCARSRRRSIRHGVLPRHSDRIPGWEARNHDRTTSRASGGRPFPQRMRVRPPHLRRSLRSAQPTRSHRPSRIGAGGAAGPAARGPYSSRIAATVSASSGNWSSTTP